MIITVPFVLTDLTTHATPAAVRPTPESLAKAAAALTDMLTLESRRAPRATFRVAAEPSDRRPGEVSVNFRDAALPSERQSRVTYLDYPKPQAPPPRPESWRGSPPPGAPPLAVPDVEIDCSAHRHPMRLYNVVDTLVASAAGRTMGASSLAALARNIVRARQRRIQRLRAAKTSTESPGGTP